MLEQPVPRVSETDISRIVHRDFPAPEVPEAVELLRRYGLAPWEQEIARATAAVLKLAAGDSQRLEHYAEVAGADYRDVLAWAEYPEYVERSPKIGALGAAEEAAIVQRDWQQYDEWFSRP